MKILVAAHGTRGDVQPAIAIAHALQGAGHQVRLCAPKTFAGWATGMDFHPIDVDPAAAIGHKDARERLQHSSHLGFIAWMEKLDAQDNAALSRALVEASDGVEHILAHVTLIDRAWAVADYRQLSFDVFSMIPLWPTRQFMPPLLGAYQLGPLNYPLHLLLQLTARRAMMAPGNMLRTRLGLPTVRDTYLRQAWRSRWRTFETYSHTLSPKPPEWSDAQIMTGRIKRPHGLDETGLPPELQAWLEAGPPPLFVSFGSMPLLNERVMHALDALDRRVVIVTGWTEAPLTPVTPTRYMIRAVNHEALLPRCAAAMHHGGAGTTAAIAEAGLPMIVCPAFVDQPFWADRVRRLGLGTIVPYRRITARTLTPALQGALAAQPRATEVSALVRAEADGAAVIASMIAKNRSTNTSASAADSSGAVNKKQNTP